MGNNYIQWCRCSRRILTTQQIRENKLCELCQKEHAKEFPERFKKLGKKGED